MSVSFSGFLGSEWTTVIGPPDLPTQTNFTGNALPTTATDVIIGQPGTLAPTVSISQQNYQSVYSSLRVGAGNLEIYGGGTLNANASAMTIAGNITNLGNLNVNTDLVTVNGNILNDGLLTISAESVGGNNSSVLRLEGTTNLTGTGNLRLIGAATEREGTDISAELTGAFPTGISFLENASRISGQGLIGFRGNAGDPGGVLVLHNLAGGVIDANRTTGSLTISNDTVTAANPTTNAGTLMATAGGRLDIRSQVVEQSPLGVILANGAGSRVDLWDTIVRGGLVASSSGGLIQSTNFATTLDGSTSFGAVTLTTGTVFDVGPRTILKGAIVNQGTIRQNSYNGETRIGTEGATLSGGGDLAMSFDWATSGYTEGARLSGVSETATSTLTNVDNHIRGSGYIGKYSYSGFYNDLALVNQAGGRISADFAGQTLYLQGLISVANAGTMRAVNGATLAIQNLTTDGSSEDAMTVQNPGGTILADGAGSRVLLTGFNGAANQGRLTIAGGTLAGINGGEVRFNGQADTFLDGSTNQGAVTLQGIFRVETSGTFRGAIRNEGDIVFRLQDGHKLFIAKEGAALSAGGRVTLTGDIITGETQSTYDSQTNTRLNPAPAVLTNTNNTITGNGLIGSESGGNPLSLVNEAGGVIRANVAPVGVDTKTLTIGTGYTITNNGLIEANGANLVLLDQVTTGGIVRVANGGTLQVRVDLADDIDFSGAGAETVRFSAEYVDASSFFARSNLFSTEENPRDLNYGGTLRGMGVGDTVAVQWAPQSIIGNPTDIALNTFNWSQAGAVGTLSYFRSGTWPAGQENAIFRIEGVERSQIEFYIDNFNTGFRRVATTDGDGGANRIVGTEGKDRLLGLGGDDTLVGAGADAFDLFDGGDGNDTVDYSAYLQGFEGYSGRRVGVSVNLDAVADAVVSKDETTPTFDLLRSIENAVGTNFADNFSSNGPQNNRFDGMGGDDLFSSNGGDDTFNGGEGSDWFTPGVLPDGNFSFAFNAAGDGVFQAATGLLTYTSMEGILAGVQQGDVNVTGNAAANRLILSTGRGNIIIDGLGGNDSIVGSHFGSFDVPSAILLRGGDGGDSITGSGRADTLIGDGTRLTTPEEKAILRLYLATLNRAPDEAGWSDWTGQLLGGRSLNDIAEGFVGSQEFQRVYGTLDNPGFVTLLYNNVLKRAPDAGGLAAYVDALNAGLTRKEVVTGFSQSAEFRTTTSSDTHAGQVYRLYGATLARAPDAGGFETWTDALGGGRSLVDIAAGFVNSTEFQQRYGALDDAGFVNLLYQNVLGRAADTGGLAYWTGQLGSGAQSRTQVVTGFSESTEYIVGTRPGADGFMRTVMSGWNDTIDGGGGDDLAAGGRGSDRFVFSRFNLGNDTVYGFDSYDTLELNGFGFADPAAALAAVTQQGANAVLAYDGGSITFVETDVSLLRGLSAQGWVLG